MNIYIYIYLGCFPVEEMKKKSEENEKKKEQQKISWATAQLCHDTMEIVS